MSSSPVLAAASPVAASNATSHPSTTLQIAGYDIVSLLGEGAYGSVYEAIRHSDKKRVAIKRVLFDLVPDEIDDVLREISFMAVVDKHSNLVDFYDAVIHPLPNTQPSTASSPTGSNISGGGLDAMSGGPTILPGLCIVEELVNGGTVQKLLEHREPLSEGQVAAITADVLEALCHLHNECRIVHRDIKCSNLLISVEEEEQQQGEVVEQSGNKSPSDRNIRIKLCDFGASGRLTGPNMKRHTVIGTPGWMAPEVLAGLTAEAAAQAAAAGAPTPLHMRSDTAGGSNTAPGGGPSASHDSAIKNTGHSFPTDIWSLGVTIIEMLVARSPQEDPFFGQLMQKLSRQPLNQPASLGSDALDNMYSTSCRDFVRQCFVRDPAQRPTAQRLLRHPFIAKQLVSDGKQRDENLKTLMPRMKILNTTSSTTGGGVGRSPTASKVEPLRGLREAGFIHSERPSSMSTNIIRSDQLFYDEAEVEAATRPWVLPDPSLTEIVIPPPTIASNKSLFDKVLMTACRKTSTSVHKMMALQHQQQNVHGSGTEATSTSAQPPNYDQHNEAMDKLLVALRHANDTVPDFTRRFCDAFAGVNLKTDDDKEHVQRMVNKVQEQVSRGQPVATSSHKVPNKNKKNAQEQAGGGEKPSSWYGNPKMASKSGAGRRTGGSPMNTGQILTKPTPANARGKNKHAAPPMMGVGGGNGAPSDNTTPVNPAGVLYNQWLEQWSRKKFEGRQAFSQPSIF